MICICCDVAHVDVYRSINMTCTTILHLSMLSRSDAMKHSEVKRLINSELPACLVEFRRKPRFILKRRVQCGPDGMEPSSITWSRRITKWLRQIHPHQYHVLMRVQQLEMIEIGGMYWRQRSRWKAYILWRRWIKMLYPSLSQRIGWCDTLIFCAIDHRISTESIQYIKRKLNMLDNWVSMELAKDHTWNRMSNDSYFNDAEEFNGYRGSDCPSVSSRCSRPMRDQYPVNWIDWICRQIKSTGLESCRLYY